MSATDDHQIPTAEEARAEVRRRFDDRAPTYDESAMHRGLANAVAGFVLEAGAPGDVLDVATGTGLVLRALRERSERVEPGEGGEGGGPGDRSERDQRGEPSQRGEPGQRGESGERVEPGERDERSERSQRDQPGQRDQRDQRSVPRRPGDHTATGRMIGVDLAPRMLEVARTHLPEAELIEADAATLPLPDDCVDLVTCVTGLQLFTDVPGAIREWARVLRPGGRVVTATFVAFDPSRHRAAPPAAMLHHEPFRSPEALDETFARVGLRVARHERWTDGADDLLIAELVPGRGDHEGAAAEGRAPLH